MGFKSTFLKVNPKNLLILAKISVTHIHLFASNHPKLYNLDLNLLWL